MGKWAEYQQPAGTTEKLKEIFAMPTATFGGAATDLVVIFNRYRSLFKSKTRDIGFRAEQYLRGLFQAKKKNMERMAKVVPNTNDQAYQHFLSKSSWQEDAVIDQIRHDTNQLIGGQEDSRLIIDETGRPKKSQESVGVSRQYCGQKGKVENCQVGVFTVLAQKQYIAPIDGRLFLPKSWVSDIERCRQAGVPEEFIEYQRKQDLAAQLVVSARLRGVQFDWIGCDATTR